MLYRFFLIFFVLWYRNTDAKMSCKPENQKNQYFRSCKRKRLGRWKTEIGESIHYFLCLLALQTFFSKPQHHNHDFYYFFVLQMSCEILSRACSTSTMLCHSNNFASTFGGTPTHPQGLPTISAGSTVFLEYFWWFLSCVCPAEIQIGLEQVTWSHTVLWSLPGDNPTHPQGLPTTSVDSTVF